jgi:hypothetical protein
MAGWKYFAKTLFFQPAIPVVYKKTLLKPRHFVHFFTKYYYSSIKNCLSLHPISPPHPRKGKIVECN